MPSLTLTHIALRVADLSRSRDFYTRRVGFVVVNETPDQIELATQQGAPAILSLSASRRPISSARDSAGLFHAALLFQSRRDLANWLTFAGAQQLEFDGFSDHGVSEAIYFSDPDGNGLEFYADRSREEWPYKNGELAMITRPLDVQKLLAEAEPAAVPLAGTTWGHLHLRVTDVERSENFYRTNLGVATTQRSYPGARFLGADGYHHHIGLNSWGNPSQPHHDDRPGLGVATFARPGTRREELIVDPDGIPLKLVPARA